MTSGTGWRETARINANRTFDQKPWPLSRIARRISPLLGRGLKGRERFVVLAAGLAGWSANHRLEDLVLAEAGCPRSGDVLISDMVGVLGDFVDQSVQRLAKPCVVIRGTALGARCLAVSFQDPRDQRLSRLRNIRHAIFASHSAARRANNSRRRPAFSFCPLSLRLQTVDPSQKEAAFRLCAWVGERLL